MPSERFKNVFIISAFSIILASLYAYGALQHLRYVNTTQHRTDQGAYMYYAKKMYQTNYAYVGHRNRMPVYPFLQSLIYSPQLSDNEYFVRGKYFNILLSLSILLSLFIIFRQYLPSLQAINLTLITAFTVFIFKAAYFQGELLFYFLNFCGYLLMCKLLINPGWKWAVAAGLVIGLAHLTKASVLPGLILFLVFMTLKATYTLYPKLKAKMQINPGEIRTFVSQPLSIALVIVVFLATVYPYISTSKTIFGRYFYNVNSTFYMWYDSWEEVKKGTRAHGDRVGWPEMLPELIPRPGKFFESIASGK